MPDSPRAIGLVLSGGGTRLFAHIGFLWALDDAGLLEPGQAPLRCVVGNSAGSLVGAMLALGYTPREMWETAYWRAWSLCPPDEPRAWRKDPRPRGLDLAMDPDLSGLAKAVTRHLGYFKGVDTGLRFEALLRRILERELPDGQANPYFTGTRPPEGMLPLYLIGFNLTNRRETVFQYQAHCPAAVTPTPDQIRPDLGRELSYEVCSDSDAAASADERFRPWEGVRISTSLPVAFRPYYKPLFVSTHWDAQGRPQQLKQGCYFSDGGSRDNYSLSAAIKLAGCDAVFGCFLGNPDYPFQAMGHGTLVDVVQRNVDGMMHAIFEADQDDAEISAHPIRTCVPHIEDRHDVTFDMSTIGAVMEAGYIAAAYYVRRTRPGFADDRSFLNALVNGRVRVSWAEMFALGGDVWGPAAARHPGSDYCLVQPSAEFCANATAFFAETYPGVRGLFAGSALDQELARRNAQMREVAPDELEVSPFRDMPLAVQQRRIVDWAGRLSWIALSGVVAGLGSAILALWAAAGTFIYGLPLSNPLELWVAEILLLAAAVVAGYLGRRAAIRYAWEQVQKKIRQAIGF